MPANVIASFAEKSGKSKKEVETLWDRAKEVVKDQYKNVDDKSDKYFQLVVGVLKNMLKLKDEDALITTQSANIGDGQDGQFQKRMSFKNGKDKEKEKENMKKVMGYIKSLK